MKMKKWILAGAVALLASVVFFGCKQEVTSDVIIKVFIKNQFYTIVKTSETN